MTFTQTHMAMMPAWAFKHTDLPAWWRVFMVYMSEEFCDTGTAEGEHDHAVVMRAAEATGLSFEEFIAEVNRLKEWGLVCNKDWDDGEPRWGWDVASPVIPEAPA